MSTLVSMLVSTVASSGSSLLGSIPSPSSGSLELGPLKLNAYGLMIALGVIAAVWLASRRAEAKGVATAEDFNSIALWAVPAGVVGGRLYHVATDWERFEGRRLDMVKIWEGGLGIWGGIALGVAVGLWRAKVRGLPIGAVLDCAAPAIALAQAIGRWGNWFNQELFGRPTDLPWALEVSDSVARAAGHPVGTTFHPTFLYESLWCLVLCAALIRIDARREVAPGRLFVLYAAGYSAVRFFIEGLRIDEADELGGLRFNQWMSIAVVAVSVGILVADARRRRPLDQDPSGSTVAP